MADGIKFSVGRSIPITPTGPSLPGYLGVMGFAECEVANHTVKVEVAPSGPSDKDSNKTVSQFVDDLYALLDKYCVKLPPHPSGR